LQINQPKGIKPKMRRRKLRRDVNWQAALKQNRVNQDLCLYPSAQYFKYPNYRRFSTWILYVSLSVWRPVNRKTTYFINTHLPYNFFLCLFLIFFVLLHIFRHVTERSLSSFIQKKSIEWKQYAKKGYIFFF
jgi:hypothetical protein